MAPKTRSKPLSSQASSLPNPIKEAAKSARVSKPTKPSLSKRKKPFRNIPQGAGVTLTLSPPTVVGTTDCNTCLGLYVPISLNPPRAFVAHFNFEPQSNTGRTRKQKLSNYVVGPACYRAVVMMTKEFLADAQWKGCWGPLTNNMKQGLRMVCPKTRVGGKQYTGDAICEGVKEFFGVTDEEMVPRRCGNVLVRYAEGEEGLVMYPSETELARDWEARDEEDTGDFAVSEFFDDGRVEKGEDTEGPFV